MRKLIGLLLWGWIPILIATSVAEGQELANYSGMFVDIGFGARGLGMGRANTSLVQGMEAITWNPAGLADRMGWGVTFSHARQFNIIPYNFAAWSSCSQSGFAMGFGAIYSGDELLQETTLMPAVAFSGEYASVRYRAGVTVSLMNAQFGNDQDQGAISGSAIGLGVTVGAKLLLLNDRFILGMVLRNALNHLTWSVTDRGGYSQNLPTEWRIGVGLIGNAGVHVGVDIAKSLYQDVPDRLFLGGEKVINRWIALRAGVANNMARWENLFYGIGLGLTHPDLWHQFSLTLDFAYLIDPIANSVFLSISIFKSQ